MQVQQASPSIAHLHERHFNEKDHDTNNFKKLEKSGIMAR